MTIFEFKERLKGQMEVPILKENETIEISNTTCCICGNHICGYGNNPWPVKDQGKCCDECNKNFVELAKKRLTEICLAKSVTDEIDKMSARPEN